MIPFSVPPTAKEVLELVCQLRDGDRDDAWGRFVSIVASWHYEDLSALWESCAGKLGLTITRVGEERPVAHAVRVSYDPLTNRAAWRV